MSVLSTLHVHWRVSHIRVVSAILFSLSPVGRMLRLKTIENFKLLAQNVVKVAYRRWLYSVIITITIFIQDSPTSVKTLVSKGGPVSKLLLCIACLSWF